MVTHYGIGISKEPQDRIFGKFEQADATNSRKVAGSGLGLNLCRSLIDHSQC